LFLPNGVKWTIVPSQTCDDVGPRVADERGESHVRCASGPLRGKLAARVVFGERAMVPQRRIRRS